MPPERLATAPAAASEEAERWFGLGSSDVAAIAGISSYATPMDVYLVKKGLAEKAETVRMRAGTRMEPVIAAWYAEEDEVPGRPEKPAAIVKAPTLRHPDEPWARSTIDFFALDAAKQPIVNVECKNIGNEQAHKWGPPGTDEAPRDYLTQVQWQMGIARAHRIEMPRSDIAALFGGNELCVYPVVWDEELFALLWDAAKRFWYEHIVPGVPPAFDGSERASKYLKEKYKALPADRIAPAPIDALPLMEKYHAASAAEKDATKQKEVAQQALEDMIGKAGIAGFEGGGFRATWRPTAGGGFDYKGAAEHFAGRLGLDAKALAPFARPGHRRFSLSPLRRAA